MKFFRTLTPFLVLGMALAVTAGSVYVTVKAAAQPADEATPIAAPSDETDAVDTEADANADAVESETVDAVVIAADEVTIVEAPGENAGAAVALDAPDAVGTPLHQISLNGSGGFSGRLSALQAGGDPVPAAGVAVQVLSNGNPVASTFTNDEGVFSVSGLTEGVVALVASSDDALLLFGVRLVAGSTADAIPVKYSNFLELEVNSAVVSGADAALAAQLVFGFLPSDGKLGCSGSGLYSPGTGEPSSAISTQPISLGPDGSVSGVVLDPETGRVATLRNMKVSFLRDGAVATTVAATPSGLFSATGLEPGVYGVVATGEDSKGRSGATAIGVELVADVAAANAVDSKYKLASFTNGTALAGNSLTLCPTFGESESDEELPPVVIQNDSGGGGGGGGGLFPPIFYWEDGDASPGR